MKKYEKQISIKQILFSFLRHWLIVILVIAGFVATGVFYASSTRSSDAYTYGSLVNSSMVFEQTRMTTVQNSIDNQEFCEMIEEKLQTLDIYHEDGNFIRASEIRNGLIYPEYSSETTSNYYQIIYKNFDKTIVEDVLNLVLDEAVMYLSNEFSFFSNLKVGSRASDPQVIIVDNRQGIFIFAAMGIVVAFGLSVLVDLNKDKVYNAFELEFLDLDVFETKKKSNLFGVFNKNGTAKKKEELSNVLSNNEIKTCYKRLHSNLETYGDTKIMAVISPTDIEFSNSFANSLSVFYASLFRKTLIVNLDLSSKNVYIDNKLKIQSLVLENIELYDIFHHENPTNLSPLQNVVVPVKPNLDTIHITTKTDSIEMIKTRNFAHFIEICKDKYKHIIFVLPPLVESKEILLLKKHLTAAIVVCEASTTKKKDVYCTVNTLKENDFKNIGVVLVK